MLCHQHNHNKSLLTDSFSSSSKGCKVQFASFPSFPHFGFFWLVICISWSFLGRISFSVENDSLNRFPVTTLCWVDGIFSRVLSPLSLDQWPLQQVIIITHNCTIWASWNYFYWHWSRWYVHWWFLFRGTQTHACLVCISTVWVSLMNSSQSSTSSSFTFALNLFLTFRPGNTDVSRSSFQTVQRW